MATAKGKRKFRSAALQYTYDRYIGHDPKLVQEYEEEVVNAEVALQDLRPPHEGRAQPARAGEEDWNHRVGHLPPGRCGLRWALLQPAQTHCGSARQARRDSLRACQETSDGIASGRRVTQQERPLPYGRGSERAPGSLTVAALNRAAPNGFFYFAFTAKSQICMLSLPGVYSMTAYSPGTSGSWGRILYRPSAASRCRMGTRVGVSSGFPAWPWPGK